jgi:hypothetical protein
LYEQAIKSALVEGGGVEEATPEDIASTFIGYCSSAFDGSSASDAL